MLTPSPARMYDALLGGSHNFEVDRQAAAMAAALVPDLPKVALSNRAFLRRSVRYLAEQGIDQFLDVGSGIPTAGSSHEIAQADDPARRVHYVDIDPVAVAHSQSILEDNPNATVTEGDLRDPASVLSDVREAGLIDLDRPVGVLLIAVLHLVSDQDRPHEVVAALRDELPSGSYVVISHLSSASRPEDAAALGDHAQKRSGVPIIFRSREQITAMFDGLDLVEPGVVELPQWHPESSDDVDEAPGRSLGLAGAARRN